MTSAPQHSSGSRVSKSGHDITALPESRINELAEKLTPEERRIMLDHGTEPPFCGGLLNNKGNGLYICRLCGLPLFKSQAKFESHTGWPSFYEPFDPDHVAQLRDESFGMIRTEIRCRRCGSHLGHVFDDGPAPTGKRFCLNSVALEFQTAESGIKPSA
jgi:peptide-methionine (R)-S-oxide reductase